MLWKKLALVTAAGAALAAAVPAYADPPPWAPAHGWRAKHRPHHRDYVVVHRHYVPVERGVIVHPPIYYEVRPAPVYYGPPAVYGSVGVTVSGDAALGALGGALIGAVIGHQIGAGY
jgi:hypothetical protein